MWVQGRWLAGCQVSIKKEQLMEQASREPNKWSMRTWKEGRKLEEFGRLGQRRHVCICVYSQFLAKAPLRNAWFPCDVPPGVDESILLLLLGRENREM